MPSPAPTCCMEILCFLSANNAGLKTSSQQKEGTARLPLAVDGVRLQHHKRRDHAQRCAHARPQVLQACRVVVHNCTRHQHAQLEDHQPPLELRSRKDEELTGLRAQHTRSVPATV